MFEFPLSRAVFVLCDTCALPGTVTQFVLLCQLRVCEALWVDVPVGKESIKVDLSVLHSESSLQRSSRAAGR